MATPSSPNGVLFEKDGIKKDDSKTTEIKSEKPQKNFKLEFVWLNVFYMFFLHGSAIYAIYLVITSAKISTTIFALCSHFMFGLGATAGAHRLWSHRSYKATWQLRLLLMLLNSGSLQGHILAWARDHRVHHKYSDTMADPYSTARGFFFAHYGWLTVRKHPDVIEKGKGIDISDLEADPIVQFQKKHYWSLMIPTCILLPTLVPVYCWNETWTNSFFIAFILRATFLLNSTFAINSFGHTFGYKPYDRNMRPVNNIFLTIWAVGEGWHNFHHTFPWDYYSSEFGSYSLNMTSNFIDFFAWVGWAYDLKKVSPDIIKKRVQRTGDGSHEIWGWGDEDMNLEDEKAAIIIHKTKSK